jgi:hypothetical protein
MASIKMLCANGCSTNALRYRRVAGEAQVED